MQAAQRDNAGSGGGTCGGVDDVNRQNQHEDRLTNFQRTCENSQPNIRRPGSNDSENNQISKVPSSSGLYSLGPIGSDVIYETLATKPLGPCEAFYRERLALSEKNGAKNPSALSNVDLSSFTGLVHLSDASYASRYLAGVVPYPSLPSFGSVVPSSESLVDILELATRNQNFPSFTTASTSAKSTRGPSGVQHSR